MGERHKDFPVCKPGYIASVIILTYNHSLSLSYPTITMRDPTHTTAELAELSLHPCSVARTSKLQDSSWQLTQSLVPGGGDYIERGGTKLWLQINRIFTWNGPAQLGHNLHFPKSAWGHHPLQQDLDPPQHFQRRPWTVPTPGPSPSPNHQHSPMWGLWG